MALRGLRSTLALLLAATVLAGVTPAAAATRLVPGRVTIIGDSVTIDARTELLADIRGAAVHAETGEQWDQGVTYAGRLRREGRLGDVVVLALGTNGPISWDGMAYMLRVLSGCTRVVLVTNHVPMWWQQTNNRLFRAVARAHRRVVVADWASLAAAHPRWTYPDGVHMAIGGTGAAAFARLVASRLPPQR